MATIPNNRDDGRSSNNNTRNPPVLRNDCPFDVDSLWNTQNIFAGIFFFILVISVIVLSVGITACNDPKNIDYQCPYQVVCSGSTTTSSSQTFYGPCGTNNVKDNNHDPTCEQYCSSYTTPKCLRITISCDGQSNTLYNCVGADAYCGNTAAADCIVVGSVLLTFDFIFYCLLLCWKHRKRTNEERRVAAEIELNRNNRYSSPQIIQQLVQQQQTLPQSTSLYSRPSLETPINPARFGSTGYPQFDNMSPSRQNNELSLPISNNRSVNIPSSRPDDQLSLPMNNNRSVSSSSRADRVRGSLSANSSAYRDYWEELNGDSAFNETSRNNPTNSSPSNRYTAAAAPSTSTATTRSNRDISITNNNGSQSQSNRMPGSSSRYNPTTTSPSNRPVPWTENSTNNYQRTVPQVPAPVTVNNVRSSYHQPTTTIVVVAEAVMSSDDHRNENIPIVEAIPLL